MRGYFSVEDRQVYLSILVGESAGSVLILQPFGEEKRCALRTAVCMQRAFAATGRSAAIFDYSGTGDSSGRHEEAALWQWRTEAGAIAAELRREYGPLTIVALRSGTLVSDKIAAENLVLVEPYLSGGAFLRDLEMRQRMKSFAEGQQNVPQNEFGARDFGGFLFSEKMQKELQACQVNPDFPEIAGRKRLIHVTGGKSYPPAYQPLLAGMEAEIVNERPFWGLTDYFEPALLLAALVR